MYGSVMCLSKVVSKLR